MEKVILNHLYQDGNKQTALFAVDMFLKINRYRLQKKLMENDDTELNQGLADAHVLVATSEWTSETSGITMPVWLGLEKMSKETREYSKNAVEH